ncbi:MAG TPA: TIGR02391 family protein [Candidatus Thermoplasmatota archaeon]|nr:TIGR02391 family protein [Candidatus Thermoplasmatota archaeon]
MPAKSKRGASSARPAAIQYLGMGGYTQSCIEAVELLLQFGREVEKARILTHVREHVPATDEGPARDVARHCLLLTINESELVAVKSGFSSGYGGEGPAGLSFILQLLDAHGVEITESDVEQEFIERVDCCLLTYGDLDRIASMDIVMPHRWYDYVWDRDETRQKERTLWRQFPLTVPYALMDPRLIDLAIDFWAKPNDHLRTAFARLEDSVRKRTGLREHGAELFKQAFLPPTLRLEWEGLDDKERAARTLLFQSVFGAHRNPRAHRELDESRNEQLSQFLLVNHLFSLESEAKPKAPSP